jgi:hypothetical protein
VMRELARNDGRNILMCETTVLYRTKVGTPPAPDERHFPRLVKMRRGPYDPVGHRPLPGLRTSDIESPSPTLGAVSLSSASIDAMVRIGLPRSLARAIFEGRARFGRPYADAAAINRMLETQRFFDPATQVTARVVVGPSVLPSVGDIASLLDALVAGGVVKFNDQD